MKILLIYSSSQTYTSTVFEHLDAFKKHSNYHWYYLDYQEVDNSYISFTSFDAVFVHYTVRLPFRQLSSEAISKLKSYPGLKGLFIQDEYDHTNLTKKTIKEVAFDIVFTVVPINSVSQIYSNDEFPNVRFVSNLTGYVPEDLSQKINQFVPASRRNLYIGYRGRELPIRYGALAAEKLLIGKTVKQHCEQKGLLCDIEWDESSRIYGDEWYRFISSAKAMLGSESGSNIFDWDGCLQECINDYKLANPQVSDYQLYIDMLASREVPGLMNQISPRIFEMAAARTVMILFEGSYSDVLTPYDHYIPLRKNFSNIDDVLKFLDNGQEIDALADRAFKDIILSEKYSYRQFVIMVDREIELTLKGPRFEHWFKGHDTDYFYPAIKKEPQRAISPLDIVVFQFMPDRISGSAKTVILSIWQKIPIEFRPCIKLLLGRNIDQPALRAKIWLRNLLAPTWHRIPAVLRPYIKRFFGKI